jgi:hypothetical protein
VEAVGLFFTIVGVLLALLAPPLSVKIVGTLVCVVSLCWLIRKSPWTHACSERMQILLSVGVAIVISMVAVPQFAAQWKSEHPSIPLAVMASQNALQPSPISAGNESDTTTKKSSNNVSKIVPEEKKRSPRSDGGRGGYGLRNSTISDIQSNGSSYTIYNGGFTDQVDYKNVCNGVGGIAIANRGPATNVHYDNITSGNGCPPVPSTAAPQK